MNRFAKIYRSGIALMLLMGLSPVVQATEHIIEAQSTKFSPLFMFIDPGDTVSWVKMVGHDAQAIPELVPEGAELWHLGMGVNGNVTFDVEGVYIYKCTPHYSLGMAGAIVVGKATNLEQIKQHVKGMSKRVLAKLLKADWPADRIVSEN